MSTKRPSVIVALAVTAIAGVSTGVLVLAHRNAGSSHRGGAAVSLRRVQPSRARIRRRRAELAARRFQLVERSALTHVRRLGLPVRCGGFSGHDVALTFDDGPGPYSSKALSILRLAHARATWFLAGKELRHWPFIPAAELRDGALGDHTWTHPDLPRLSTGAIRRELASTKEAIQALTHARVSLFRPPYGAHDARVDREARSLGLLEVLWSVDTRDSEGAPWDRIAAAVRRFVRPGSIVLMHENRGQTIRALKFAILPWLRKRHLAPVTVPELLALDPPSPAQLVAGVSGCYPGHGSGTPGA